MRLLRKLLLKLFHVNADKILEIQEQERSELTKRHEKIRTTYAEDKLKEQEAMLNLVAQLSERIEETTNEIKTIKGDK